MARAYQLPNHTRIVDGNDLQLAVLQKARTDASYALYLLYLALIALVGGSVYLFTHRPESVTQVNALLALAIVWMGAIPGLLYLAGASAEALPFLPLFGAAFSIFYGLTVFSKSRTPGILDSVVISTASLALALTGLILLYIAFYITKLMARGGIRPLHFAEKYNPGQLRILAALLMMIHLAYIALPAIQLTGAFVYEEAGGYIAHGIFFLQWRRKQLPAFYKLIYLFIALPAELIIRFSTGALAQIIVFGLFYQILVWYKSRRIPWLLIIALLAFFIPLQPVKAEYRKYTFEHGRYARLDPLAKAQLFVSLAYEYYFGAVNKTNSDTAGAASSRVADSRILSYVVSRTPEPVPYWNGKTLTPILTKPIPRALWPNKPIEDIGQEFGHRYSFLAPNDTITSINLPWLVELYANFGSWGIFIGMPIIGMLFAYVAQKFARGASDLDFVFGAALLFRLSVDQESNFSLVAGGLITVAFAMWLYFKIGFRILGARTERPKARIREYDVVIQRGRR